MSEAASSRKANTDPSHKRHTELDLTRSGPETAGFGCSLETVVGFRSWPNDRIAAYRMTHPCLTRSLMSNPVIGVVTGSERKTRKLAS